MTTKEYIENTIICIAIIIVTFLTVYLGSCSDWKTQPTPQVQSIEYRD